MTASRSKVLAAHLFLACALTTGAQAKTVTIRIKADGGRLEYSHLGKRLTDQSLEQLCAAARQKKSEIVFQRDKMSGDNALDSILGEARCLGAKNAGATKTKIKRSPTSKKAAAHTHAKHRHTKSASR